VGIGLTMRIWLRYVTGNPRTALCGAIVYMVAPYHLFDHYIRGAFAEFTAYAILPLVILAIELAADRRRGGVPLLALSYGALVMTHLPIALLASATIIPAFILFRTWRHSDHRAAVAFLMRCAGASALGLGLAALYLLPAMLLQAWISADQLWRSDFHVEHWFIVRPDRWLEPFDMKVIAWLSLAYATLAAALSLVLLRLKPDDAWRHQLGFWVALALITLVLLSGLVPWFWQLPELAKVQFPWRLMVVVEFAAITAFYLTSVADRRGAAMLVVAASIVLAAPAAALIARSIVVRTYVTWHDRAPAPHDVKEYMPAGFPLRPGLGYAELGLEPVKDVPLISCRPAAKSCKAENDALGRMRLTIENEAQTTVVLQRFFFPAWRVGGQGDRPVVVVPTDPLRLVSFSISAGQHTLILDRKILPIEQWGWGVSALSLALLATWTVLGWRREQP
jgi:hypothetical protein